MHHKVCRLAFARGYVLSETIRNSLTKAIITQIRILHSTTMINLRYIFNKRLKRKIKLTQSSNQGQRIKRLDKNGSRSLGAERVKLVEKRNPE